MNYREKLSGRIRGVNSRLCVGLDPRIDAEKTVSRNIDELREFLFRAIGETAEFAAAFKPNIAYFEALGVAGYRLLEEVIGRIPADAVIVLDCKRGDIAETQRQYVRAYFENWNVDAVTLSPYMGFDSLEPFLQDATKAVYALALTSNPGAADLQLLKATGAGCSSEPEREKHREMKSEQEQENEMLLEQDAPATYLFERVLQFAVRAKTCAGTLGFVCGLTNIDENVLARIPDAPLLIPGLGAQGGDLASLKTQKRGAPLLINVSRGVLYGDPGSKLAQRAQHFQGMINDALDG